MFSVPLGVSPLVHNSSGAEEANQGTSLLGKYEANGTDHRKKGARVFNQVLNGTVGSVIHSICSVFLVQDHRSLSLFVLSLEEKRIGSNVPLEAIFVTRRGKIEQGDSASEQDKAEVNPLEVSIAEGLDLTIVYFLL